MLNREPLSGGSSDIWHRISAIWGWVLADERWTWILPILCYFLVERELHRAYTLIEAVIGLGFVLLVARFPYRALTALVIFLPFEQITFAWLLRLGFPAHVLRGLGFWKEGVVVGLTIVALRKIVRQHHRWDWIDKVVLSYLVLGLVFLFVPALFLASTEAGAHLSFYTRELGWRTDALYLGLFVVGRHLRIDPRQLDALGRRTVGAGVAVSLIGIYEFIRPSSFNRFLVHTVRLGQYQQRVLHSASDQGTNLLVYASNGHVRVGSVFVGYLFCGPYLVVILALAIERAVRIGSRLSIIAILVTLTALSFTQQRDSIIGGVVVIAFGLRRQIGRSLVHRIRLSSMLLLGAISTLPILALGGLLHRFVSSHGSNSGHQNRVIQSFHVMLANPFGRGLSTGAGAGQSAVTRGLVSAGTVLGPENQFLLIGTELGFLGLLLYAASAVAIFRSLRTGLATEEETAAVTAAGLRTAMLGLVVPCMVSQPFINVALDFPLFALLGAAAGSLDAIRQPSPKGSGWRYRLLPSAPPASRRWPAVTPSRYASFTIAWK